MSLTPEDVASLLYELQHNDLIIETMGRCIRYSQDERFSLALSDDDLLSLGDIQTRKAFFTVKILDQKQSLVDLVLRAYSACPGRDFFEYTSHELVFPFKA